MAIVIGIFNPPEEGGGGDPGVNQLLEDFATLRLNDDGNPLFSAYTTEDPGSSSSIVSGSLRVLGSATVGRSIYMHFFPIYDGDFPYPEGLAQHYIKTGTWDPDNNRLSFIVRSNTALTRRSDGGSNMQFGTYVKNPESPDSEEGRHFYHHMDLNLYANRWFKVWIDRHPQHERSAVSSINWAENVSLYPPFGAQYGPVNYMEGLSRFYWDPQPAGLESSIWDFDDFYFSKVTGEPDYDISTVVALYTGTRYEVTWAGEKGVSVTYEIRYKTTSMKTAGFTTGTSGGTTTNPGNTYEGCIWQSSVMAEDPAGMYVAIRVQGDTDFREIYLPYQLGPGNTGDQ